MTHLLGRRPLQLPRLRATGSSPGLDHRCEGRSGKETVPNEKEHITNLTRRQRGKTLFSTKKFPLVLFCRFRSSSHLRFLPP
jgi:hypothetical protein